VKIRGEKGSFVVKITIISIAAVLFLLSISINVSKPQPPLEPPGPGDGYILKRSPEEMCHACHRTNVNTPAFSGESGFTESYGTTNWDNAIKTHGSDFNGTCSNSAYTNKRACLNAGATWTPGKWSTLSEGMTTIGWGITGGKYGAFVCRTCHTAHDTKNIYLIREGIATPDGSNWHSINSQWVTVDFRYLQGTIGNSAYVMGWDSGGHITSTRVCEVCHSITSYHRYDTSGQADLGHYNAQNCVECHSHKTGFSGLGGACDACHGAPPGQGSDTNAPAQFAASHLMHYGTVGGVPPAGSYPYSSIRSTQTAYVFECGTCHSTDTNDHEMGGDGIVDVKLNAWPGGWFTPGTSYYWNTPPPGSKNFLNTDSRCSSTYCHGNFAGSGLNATPVWGSSGSASCGTCHGASISAWPAGGSHQVHIGTIGGVMLSCSKCHQDTATGFAINKYNFHVNARADWKLDPTDSRISTIGSYKGSSEGWGNTGGPYGSCSNIYCHSTAQSDSGTWPPSWSTPTWGSSPTGACGTCHLNATIASGSHLKHVSDYGYTNCTTYCHSGAGNNTSNHANYNIEVRIPSPYWGSYSQMPWNTPGQGYGNCSSTYCHSTGVSPPTYATPVWGSSPTGACGTCHGVRDTDSPSSARHLQHVGTIAGGGYKYACVICHSTVVTSTASSAVVPAISSISHHVNTTISVAFETYNPRGTVLNIGGSNSQCMQLYCHSDGTGWTSNTGDWRTLSENRWKTVTWSATLTCSGCHGDATVNTIGQPWYTTDPTGALGLKANSHRVHTSDCSQCHFATISTITPLNITSFGRHVNRLYDLVQKPGVTSFTYAYSTQGGTCSSISCHPDMRWGTGKLGCTGCHNNPQGIRRNVVAEFKPGGTWEATDWSHKRAASGAVYDKDCGVCHMEGSAHDGLIQTTFHNDGKLQFRDPDLGTEIGWASFSDSTNTYSAYGVASIGVFSRDTTSSTLEPGAVAIQINLCLKCHDADGALSTLARVDGASTPAIRPFVTISGHLPGGAVLNVRDQFWWMSVGNQKASYHPVLNRQNNAFSWRSNLVAPWTSYVKARPGDAGWTSVGGPAQWGHLITCWDCHNDDPVIGWASSRSVTAHGNVRTLRKPYDRTTAGTQLCFVCHKNTTYWSTVAGAVTRGLSAWGSSSDTADDIHPDISGNRHVFAEDGFSSGCLACHSSAGGPDPTTQPARPRAAEDTHGYNWMSTGGGTYPAVGGATVGARPFAFLRTPALGTGWRPRSWTGPDAWGSVGSTTGGYCQDMYCGTRSDGPFYYYPAGVY
jgi:predicted CxxxxCH...CXXCH cytochrome family protein